eukprot:12899789-Prorocentrum_lima.AAC.1
MDGCSLGTQLFPRINLKNPRSCAEVRMIRAMNTTSRGMALMGARTYGLTAELHKVTEAYHSQRPLTEQISAIQHTRKA